MVAGTMPSRLQRPGPAGGEEACEEEESEKGDPMKEYEKAEEVEKMARTRVIPNWHPDLNGVRIAYLFDEEIGDVKGKTCLAKIKKASPTEVYFGRVDAVMIVDKTIWNVLTPDKRLALIDHELCHLVLDNEGNVKTRAHDLEEFADVVSRHGLWTSDLQHFQEKTKQLHLFPEGLPSEQTDTEPEQPVMN